MKTTTITRLAALLMVCGGATAACSAAASQDAPATPQPAGIPMSIEGHQPFEQDGTFVATGAGLCPSGTNTSHSIVTERPTGALFDVTKTFTCNDGSGTFDMRIKASVENCNNYDRGSWYITGGTGAYTNMTGSGELRGTYYPSGACTAQGIDDDFTGTVIGGPAA